MSVNISRRTDTGKDLEHSLSTEVPVLGERRLVAVSTAPWFWDLFSVNHNLRVLKRRDPHQSGRTAGI